MITVTIHESPYATTNQTKCIESTLKWVEDNISTYP